LDWALIDGSKRKGKKHPLYYTGYHKRQTPDETKNKEKKRRENPDTRMKRTVTAVRVSVGERRGVECVFAARAFERCVPNRSIRPEDLDPRRRIQEWRYSIERCKRFPGDDQKPVRERWNRLREGWCC
jgi:hypothetical protein